MELIKTIFVFTLVFTVAINNSGVKGNSDEKKPRFMDFDSLVTGAMMSGMDIKVDKYINHGSSVVKKVTESHNSGGETIVQTQITKISGNNPAPRFRFKRDLLYDLMDTVEHKAERVKNKIAGAMADGVNIAHSIKNSLKQKLRN